VQQVQAVRPVLRIYTVFLSMQFVAQVLHTLQNRSLALGVELWVAVSRCPRRKRVETYPVLRDVVHEALLLVTFEPGHHHPDGTFVSLSYRKRNN
jgi:hypothetical protein